MSERRWLVLRADAIAVSRRHNANDWPGLCPIESGALHLLWVPFDPATGDAIPDTSTPPAVRQLRMPLVPSSQAALNTAPHSGRLLPADPSKNDLPQIVYAPFWVLESAHSEAFAVYSGLTGDALLGELPTNVAAARVQLAFCVFLSLFCTLVGGGFLFAVVGAVMALCRFAFAFSDLVIGALAGLAMSLACIAWYLVRLSALLPRLSQAPLRRVVEGRVKLPFDTSWLLLVKAAGMIVTVQLPLVVAGSLMTDTITSPVLTLVVCAQLLCGVGFAWTALRVSYREPPAQASQPFNSSEPVADLVATTLRVALFSLCGGLAAGALSLSGIAELWELPHFPAPAAAMALGAEAFALLALVVAQASVHARMVLAVGMCARSLAALWLGPWLGLFTTVGAVTIAAWGFGPRIRGAGPAGTATARSAKVLQAVRESWYFNLGAATGRLAGRSIAVFFFGFTAGPIGEIVGERIAGTMAYLGRQGKTR